MPTITAIVGEMLAERLGISEDYANKIINDYAQQHPDEVIKVSVFSPGKGGARIALRRVERV